MDAAFCNGDAAQTRGQGRENAAVPPPARSRLPDQFAYASQGRARLGAANAGIAVAVIGQRLPR
ncbi:MAG TPA: hypothetical protein VM261_09045 [Kofleriaceae bacterium]|nr:hypothetical protein [Kofleriaceae bacterium]